MDKNIWEAIKEIDWSATSIGQRKSWPQNLVTTLEICLTSPAFMMVFWGPDHLVFCNDSGKAALKRKHQSTLGKPAKEIWPDAWYEIEPIFKEIMNTGMPIKMTNQSLPFPDPHKQDIRWDYSFTPVQGKDSKEITGIVFSATEYTTRKPFAGTKSERKEKKLYERAALYRDLVKNIPLGAIFIINSEFRYILATGHALTYAGMNSSDLEGKRLWQALPPELADEHQPYYQKALNGSPFRWEHNSHGRDYITHGVPLYNDSGEVYAALAISYDITDRKKAEKKLFQQEKLLQEILDQMPSGVSIAEAPSGKLLYHNKEAIRILRHPLLDSDDNTGYIQYGAHYDENTPYPPEEYPIARALKGESVIQEEMLYRRGDGTFTTLSVNAAPVRDESGKIIRSISTFHDISELKKNQKLLKKAKDDAEKAARVKDEFLSNMSHEIRTPLHSIIGIADLLLNKNPGEDQLEKLKAMQFSSRNLLDLINDILDYSKIEAGQIEIKENEFNLHDLLESLLLSHMLKAEKNNNSLDLKLGESVPPIIKTDQLKLSQVLHNLVSNAVKFTSNGSIEVEVEKTGSEEKEIMLGFSVTDTGIGIPAEKLEKIFDKFTQVGDSFTFKQEGTGLGLSITRKLLDLMGSTIHIESEQGEGSRFYFTLKVEPGKAKPGSQKYSIKKEDKEDLRDIEILVAEDVDINREIIVQFLQDWWDITPDIASNGKEAVEKVRQKDYDIVLMDLRMPELDGYQATKAIKQMPVRKDIPVIALTADTLNTIRQNPDSVYFSDFLIKPLEPADLRHKLLGGLSMIKSKKVKSRLKKRSFDTLNQMTLGDTGKIRKLHLKAIKSLGEYKKVYSEAMKNLDLQKIRNLKHDSTVLLKTMDLNEISDLLERSKKMLGENADPKIINRLRKEGEALFDRVVEEIREEAGQ